MTFKEKFSPHYTEKEIEEAQKIYSGKKSIKGTIEGLRKKNYLPNKEEILKIIRWIKSQEI